MRILREKAKFPSYRDPNPNNDVQIKQKENQIHYSSPELTQYSGFERPLSYWSELMT